MELFLLFALKQNPAPDWLLKVYSMKKLLFACICLVCSFKTHAIAPDDSLRILLTQREQLVKDYQYYNTQNSNFWGKKSKKDLLRIIDTLKGIIRKDTDIINTIKTSTLRKAATLTVEQTKITAQVKDDQVAVTNTMYALKTQIANLENLTKSRQRKINELQEAVEQERSRKRDGDKIIAFTIIALLSLLLYVFNLRHKINLLAAKKR